MPPSKHLNNRGFSPEQTIYFGESLDGGVVAALLTERPPAGVVFGHRLPSCAPNFVNEHIVDADHNDPQMHGAAVAHVVAELADVISPHD